MEKSVIVFCLLALLGVSPGAPISCPSAEDLVPCICKRLAYGLHVTCANFDQNSDLIRAFKVLRDYQVQSVLLHELELKEMLPSDLFDGMEISSLRVERSKLNFPQQAFSGLDESLHILNVAQHSKIKGSENFSLATLNKLTELNIKANTLETVSDMWLTGKIPNVKKITLDENDIKVIENNAFASLSHLNSISVAENKIEVVKRSMFPRPATELVKIDLSENKITKLPFDFFFEMPKLTEVILTGNGLMTLDRATWTTIWEQLDTVVLTNNNLNCDKDLEWIRKLRWPAQCVGKCVAPDNQIGKTLKEFYHKT